MRKQSPAGNMADWNLGKALHKVKNRVDFSTIMEQHYQETVTA